MLRTVMRENFGLQNVILDRAFIEDVDLSKNYAFYFCGGDFYVELVSQSGGDKCNVKVFSQLRGVTWSGQVKNDLVIKWLMEIGVDVDSYQWWSSLLNLPQSKTPASEKEIFPKRKEVYVYFILNEASNKVKIGISIYPDSRIAQLQTGIHDRLTMLGYIIGDRHKERELHDKFSHLRCTGEWFDYDEELSLFIKDVLGQTEPIDDEQSEIHEIATLACKVKFVDS